MLTLRDLLSRREPTNLSEREQQGDAALLEDRYEEALALYSDSGTHDSRVGEKCGYCLCQLERWLEAAARLEPIESELSSCGMALLALACAEGWNTRHRLTAEVTGRVERFARAALVREPIPSSIAYTIFLWFSRTFSATDTCEVVTRAVEHFPASRDFRLRWAYEMLHRDQASEAYDRLIVCLDDDSTAEYIWVCATAAQRCGRHADAVRHFESLLALVHAYDREHSSHAPIRLAHAWALAQAGDVLGARQRYQAIAHEAAALDRPARIDLARHLVDLACMEADTTALAVALESLLSVWREAPARTDAVRLLYGEPEPIWFHDNTMGSVDPSAALGSYRETLLACLDQNSHGLLRYLFAEADRDRSDDYDRQQYTAAVLQAHDETQDPLVDGAYALACTLKKRPNWKAAGRAWTRYARSCFAAQRMATIEEPIEEPLDPAAHLSEKNLLAYAEGMLSEFEAEPSPHDYKIFAANLRGVLLNEKTYGLFRRMATHCNTVSSEIAAMFDAGLGAHYFQDHERAEALYWQTLERSPTHFSALYNVLLLIRGPKSAGSLAKAAKLVDSYPQDNPDEKAKLERELERAPYGLHRSGRSRAGGNSNRTPSLSATH